MLSIPPYLALSIAIGLEVFAASWLPKTEQFTALVPTLAVLFGLRAKTCSLRDSGDWLYPSGHYDH